MRAYKRMGKEGFTLVELMIVVAIIGVLAALAIYGVTKYFANAKTAEAKNTIGAISRAASAAFEREISDSQILGKGTAGNVSSFSLCDTSTTTIPDDVPAGNKVNPDPAKQVVDPPTMGWTCLRFSMTEPVLYQYSYTKDGSPVSGASGGPNVPVYTSASFFEAAAEGNLDNDTDHSFFARGGQVQDDGTLTLATQVWNFNEYE